MSGAGDGGQGSKRGPSGPVDPRRTYQCGWCGRRVELTPERAAAILWDCDRCLMAQSLLELDSAPAGDEELPEGWRLGTLREKDLEPDPDEELDPFEF